MIAPAAALVAVALEVVKRKTARYAIRALIWGNIARSKHWFIFGAGALAMAGVMLVLSCYLSISGAPLLIPAPVSMASPGAITATSADAAILEQESILKQLRDNPKNWREWKKKKFQTKEVLAQQKEIQTNVLPLLYQQRDREKAAALEANKAAALEVQQANEAARGQHQAKIKILIWTTIFCEVLFLITIIMVQLYHHATTAHGTTTTPKPPKDKTQPPESQELHTEEKEEDEQQQPGAPTVTYYGQHGPRQVTAQWINKQLKDYKRKTPTATTERKIKEFKYLLNQLSQRA